MSLAKPIPSPSPGAVLSGAKVPVVGVKPGTGSNAAPDAVKATAETNKALSGTDVTTAARQQKGGAVTQGVPAPYALLSAPPYYQPPERHTSWLGRISLGTWLKVVVVAAVALTLGLIIFALLFGKGCKKTDKSLLCAISNFGKDIGNVITQTGKYLWALLAAGVAAVAAFLGLKSKKKNE